MRILKTIETGININDPIGFYADSDNILRILADKFEKKCYAGCYVLQVERVLKMGECRINQHGSPNFGTLSVTFEVSAIVFGLGEIINGCTVKNKDKSGSIVCSTSICSIIIAPDPMLSSINEGQIISVRVGAAKYQIDADKISISAVPYFPAKMAVFYKILPGAVKMKVLADVRQRIEYEEDEMKKIKASDSKAWNTFEQLLLSYKKPPEITGTEVTLEELVNKTKDYEGKFIARDPRMNLAVASVHVHDNESNLPSDSKLRRTLDVTNVLILMLEDYCAHLRTIREMIAVYSTEDLLNTHLNLWKIFAKVKI